MGNGNITALILLQVVWKLEMATERNVGFFFYICENEINLGSPAQSLCKKILGWALFMKENIGFELAC